MKEIRFSDIFKNEEAFTFTTYIDGVKKYIPTGAAEKYGIAKEEDLPSYVEAIVYIDGVCISRIKFNKGTKIYNKLLTRNNELPVFIDVAEEIPDNTYWAIENNGKIDRDSVFWYKDKKFFNFGRRVQIFYEDGTTELNNESNFFKDMKQIATEYLNWGSNYKNRNNIKLVQVKINASSKTIRKIQKEKCNLSVGEIYPIKNTDLVGAKYIGKVDDNYEFEIYLKENGEWVYQNIKTHRSNPNIIISNSLTYGDICGGIDVEKTGAIVIDDQPIPVSFIQRKISIYDFIEGGFREMTDDDFAVLSDKEIFGIEIERIEEGGDAK